jgi:hypothetical protein
MTSFYALAPRWLGSDRYYKIYVTDQDLRGVWLGGEVYDEDAAERFKLAAQMFSPLMKLWTDRQLRQVRQRELEYDRLDLSSDDFLAKDRRNFLIAKADIEEASLDRKKWSRAGYHAAAGNVRLRLRDRTTRQWIIVGDQPLEPIAAALGHATLHLPPPEAPEAPPRGEFLANAAARPPRDDLMAELLAAPPPRQVPPALLRAARRQNSFLGVILVGLISTFLLVGFVGFLVHQGHFYDWELNSGRAAHTTGRVVTALKTDRSDRDGGAIYSYAFTFSPAGGQEEHGTSFTTGQRWSAGTIVDVDYLVSDPAIARLAGSRTTKLKTLDRQLVLDLLQPLLGLALLASGLWGRRSLRLLLENGTVGEALVQSVKPLAQRVRGKKLHKITLQLVGAAPPLVVQYYQPNQVAFFQARLVSKQPVYVLYYPQPPKLAIIRTLVPEALA